MYRSKLLDGLRMSLGWGPEFERGEGGDQLTYLRWLVILTHPNCLNFFGSPPKCKDLQGSLRSTKIHVLAP